MILDLLNFAVAHPIVAAAAFLGTTLSICFMLEELTGLVKAARGK